MIRIKLRWKTAILLENQKITYSCSRSKPWWLELPYTWLPVNWQILTVTLVSSIRDASGYFMRYKTNTDRVYSSSKLRFSLIYIFRGPTWFMIQKPIWQLGSWQESVECQRILPDVSDDYNRFMVRTNFCLWLFGTTAHLMTRTSILLGLRVPLCS